VILVKGIAQEFTRQTKIRYQNMNVVVSFVSSYHMSTIADFLKKGLFG
jgi:hypothetical protein